ncbi:MAG: hypothetical protein L0J17_15230 [Brevibacterium sp.]|nr:hypothetical protein [Brevibacterium sp.]MDN5833656.1 hypothetical protein [Brevibacterium sp.]MDN5876379.1 hypothetical protein [Brevibacterium sp.]MDN5910978.1 hypothetical protein [Brevibacterium sp.]MDN6159215.1 hypothetical protein [Brevibacterium sp.]
MTWELQAPVSDDIHRLVNPEGETLWGVVHRGFDADHPEALGVAEVDLPTGPASLLLVKPLPGGLVLDAVRSYQGLVEGELSTLFLGIVDELLGSNDARSRLCLECIGLDADGRPRIIPGISRTPPSSTRFAIGEMIYHAAHGRPWAQSPLPVTIALPECSQPLQTLVAQLLDESTADSGLHDTLAEVTAALRRTGTPSALPLLPAERDLDPGQALTARLRAAKAPAAARLPETTGAADRLRAASRDGARTRHQGSRRRRRQTWRTRISSLLPNLLERLPAGGRRRPRKWMAGPRAWVLFAVVMTVIGGAVMVRSWSSAETATSVSSPRDVSPAHETSPSQASSPSHDAAEGISDSQIMALLDELCQKRSDALSVGDGEALAALTVPDSSAAAADELLDLHAFVGNDYTIELEDPVIMEQTDHRILIDARMSTSVTTAGKESGFAPARVEFELVRHAGTWKILEVTEIDH